MSQVLLQLYLSLLCPSGYTDGVVYKRRRSTGRRCQIFTIHGFGYIPLALMFTISGVLRGAGDTTATMVLTLMSLWLFRIPVAKYLSSIPSIGVSGVWIAIALSPFVGFVLHLAYYRMGWWKSRQIIERQN